MESKGRRTHEEEEEVSVEAEEVEEVEAEVGEAKKKAKMEDVEKCEANQKKNEDEGEDDKSEVEEEEEGSLRELLRRTCWLPEVAPAYEVPAGSSADEAKRLAIEAPEFRFDHRTDLTCFGGVRPWLRKDEEWPRCSNRECTHQLQFFLQLDFRFAPDEARKQFVADDPNKLLQMFYCWTCPDTEPFSKAALLRFVPLPPAEPTSGAPTLLSLASRSVAGFLEANPDKGAEVKKNLGLADLDDKVEASLAHGALMADVAANEDPAAQLAKRPHDDEARSSENTCFSGHFPFKRLVRWVPRDDWPNDDEREDAKTTIGPTTTSPKTPRRQLAQRRRARRRRRRRQDDGEEEHETCESCKLGGWAPWVQSVSYESCPTCQAPMKNVVFNINEDDAIPFGWGNSVTGQILQCPTHLDALCFAWAV